MNTVFADSFFYIALLNPNDAAHHQARAFLQDGGMLIITSDYVLLEVLDGYCAPVKRIQTARFVRSLRSSRSTTVLPASPALFEEALQLYEQRPDKGWSITDCASFVLMRQHGLVSALTGDVHFEQAGFRALLRSRS
jgi:uncharacterized protein